MKHPERIEDYLEHIAEAIERATSFVQEVGSVEALEKDHKTQAAVIRYMEIIGEAANKIEKQAPEFIAAHPALPWNQMRGMRNRMIHNYFDVDLHVLSNTVKEDLPKLKKQVEDLLAGLRQGPDRSR
jgi:uncharacterized protein with HEPN domain